VPSQGESLVIQAEVEGIQVEVDGIQVEVEGIQVEVEGIQVEIGGIQVEVEGILTRETIQSVTLGVRTEVDGKDGIGSPIASTGPVALSGWVDFT
jgi:hypothetical protein